MHIRTRRLLSIAAVRGPRGRCWRSLLFLALLPLLLAACGQSDSAGLTVTGSTSVAPFAEHLAELYQHAHTGTAINIQSLGSSAGIQAAIDGVAEIGMSSRELKPEEADKLDELVIARDALAVIVHPANPVSKLSLKQVQDIFSGSVRSWSALGGPEQPIDLVIREAGSGTAGAFDELVMKGKAITITALRQGSNGAIRQVVAENPNAIGYISLGIVDNTVKALAINNVAPSVAHVEAGTYTFVRPFLFVWRKGHTFSPLAKQYIDYVMSAEGQQELQNLGLVKGPASP